jgi:hypothetical protein
VKLAIAFIAAVAVAILVICATRFDAFTTLVIGVAMALVAIFSGAAVTLGVVTRRLHRRKSDNESAEAPAEVIRDGTTPDAS